MKSLVFAIAGFGYGGFLSCLGFLAAGAGHGSGALFWLAASPGILFGILLNRGNERPMTDMAGLLLFASPAIFWCLVGAALGRVRYRAWRFVFVLLVLAHYVAIPPIFLLGGDFGWHNVEKTAGMLVFGALIYAIGQGGMWISFALLASGRIGDDRRTNRST